MTKIEWTRSAISDVRNLRDYIARDSEAYADHFVQKIIEVVEKAGAFPNIGRHVIEANEEGVREILVGNHRVVYRAEESRVLVLMVIHGARDLSGIDPKPWEIS
ncbi:MAG: type II toxin-antitoxin system RelE/ParE family toxin [Candidatus Acidiferrales bacterium]